MGIPRGREVERTMPTPRSKCSIYFGRVRSKALWFPARMARLTDKRCLIVGGTSGIGLTSARRFLEEGARLLVAGLPDDKQDEALRHLQPLGPVAFHPCDATDAAQVASLFEQAL